MKVILSGGGTGGHIYPALTIADQIKRLCPEADISFVGTKQGLEKDIIPRYGYPLKFIEVAGFKRSLSLDTLRSVGKLFEGLYDAWQIVKKEKPDLVIGTGGYVCGPIVFMAALYGIPCCIQEQNAMPGVTNKILSRYVRKVFLGYKEAAKYFPGKAELVYSGNPIRTEILEHERLSALMELGLDPEKKTVLVSGGSRGARGGAAPSGVACGQYRHFRRYRSDGAAVGPGRAQYPSRFDGQYGAAAGTADQLLRGLGGLVCLGLRGDLLYYFTFRHGVCL